MNKVWTFIVSKKLSTEEINLLIHQGNNFISEWTSHEQKLSSSFELFRERIIIVKVDEGNTSASGCSIDKLTRFIKNLEKQFNLELLNRLLVALKKEDQIEVVHASKVKELISQNILTENTIIYNTSASNQNELEKWEEKLNSTWLKKYLV